MKCRIPPEILLIIVKSARDDRDALKTFSLVCTSWMHTTRKTLFSRISFRQVKPELLSILNSPLCTVFHYVQGITINTTSEISHGPSTVIWVNNFLRHMRKFTTLTWLTLESQMDFDAVAQAMPPSMKRCLRRLDIYYCQGVSWAGMAAFISKFTDLTTLTCGEMYGVWAPPFLAYFLPINDDALPVVPPPSSITKLTISHKGNGNSEPIPSNILKWFTDLHSGVIDSFSTDDVPTSRSAEFRDLVVRFGPSLSRIELPFLGDNDIGRRGRLKQVKPANVLL
jgi:hypothetical protein